MKARLEGFLLSLALTAVVGCKPRAPAEPTPPEPPIPTADEVRVMCRAVPASVQRVAENAQLLIASGFFAVRVSPGGGAAAAGAGPCLDPRILESALEQCRLGQCNPSSPEELRGFIRDVRDHASWGEADLLGVRVDAAVLPDGSSFLVLEDRGGIDARAQLRAAFAPQPPTLPDPPGGGDTRPLAAPISGSAAPFPCMPEVRCTPGGNPDCPPGGGGGPRFDRQSGGGQEVPPRCSPQICPRLCAAKKAGVPFPEPCECMSECPPCN